ncbi:hypothetical protein [Winogradskyella costae]|uniref:hypothetical protein n=1 Tax=Winogradskyella costae TaxID=2697008 RepID=UPI001C53C973|nr:hypothetical protein [Winogradskyella costae]
MKINYKKILNYIIIVLLFSYIFYNWNKERDLSFEQAGTDFTQAYNTERKKMNLPILLNNWNNTHPINYKIQVWENPDTILPLHSEKTVVATPRAEFEREIDRYNLKKIGDKFYQVVIKYSKSDNLWTCTLRETEPPVKKGKGKGLRSAGKIISELTLEQANDTLKKYGIERLNY